MKHFCIFILTVVIASKARSQTASLENMYRSGAPGDIYGWAYKTASETDEPAYITNTIQIVNFLLVQYVHKIEKPYDKRNLFRFTYKVDSVKSQKFLTIVPAVVIIPDSLKGPVHYRLKNYFPPLGKYTPLVIDSSTLGALNTFLDVKDPNTGYVEDARERAAFLNSAFYSMTPRQVRRQKPNGTLEKLWAVNYSLQIKKITFSDAYSKARVHISYNNVLQQIILLEKKNGDWKYLSTEYKIVT